MNCKFKTLVFESELNSNKESCLEELALFLNEELLGGTDFDVVHIEREFVINEMIAEWNPRLQLRAVILVKCKV